MISLLRGIVVANTPPRVVLDVGGVGYEIACPLPTCADLASNDKREEIILHTHLVVREDDQALYGFSSSPERDLFRSLIKVNGVGPKLALALLSTLRPDALRGIVETGDADALTRVPGIGKKTAQRLVIELKGGLDGLMLSSAWSETSIETVERLSTPSADAVDALIALGYRSAEAQRLIDTVSQPGLSREQLIRLALRSVVQ